MKNRIILVALLATIYTQAFAQKQWYIATDVGFNTPDADIELSSTIMMDIRAWRMLNKHWQLGVALDFGRLNAFADFVWQVENAPTGRVFTERAISWTELMSPYIAPTVFAHYQLNFAKRAYGFAGPAVGIINGRASEEWGDYITSYWAGVNLGMAVPLSKHVQFTVSHAWRTTYAKLASATEYRYPIVGTQETGLSYFDDTQIHSFNMKIGLIVGL